MKVNRVELMKVLSAAKPGLSQKDIIQQQVHFIFTGEEVATYNETICILYPYKMDVKFSVWGDEFYKALESIKEEEVDISADDKFVKIEAKKTKAGLSILLGDDEKVEHKIAAVRKQIGTGKFWKKLPDDFIEAVYSCMFSTSRDMTRGTYICVATKGNRMYGTDGTIASRFVMKEEVDDMLIPVVAAEDLVKYKVTHYGKGSGWLHFKTKDGVIFSCKALVGEYPYKSLDSFFRDAVNAITLPDELNDVLKAATAFTEPTAKTAKAVVVSLEKNRIVCKSAKERGWIIKEIELEKPYKGHELTFPINPDLLLQILTKATSLVILSKRFDPTVGYPDKAQFTNKNFQHLICCLKDEEVYGYTTQ